MRAKAIHVASCIFLLVCAACANLESPDSLQPTTKPEASATPSLQPLPGPSPIAQAAVATPWTPVVTAIPAATATASAAATTTPIAAAIHPAGGAPSAAIVPFRSIEILPVPRGRIEHIVCSHDASTVAVATLLGVWLYDARSLDLVRHLADVRWPSDIDLSPDGSVLVTARAEIVQLWDLASGVSKGTVAVDFPAGSVAFSPDGELLAVGGRQGALLWDLDRNEVRYRWATGDPVSSVTFGPDGKLLAANLYGGALALWDTGTGELRTTVDREGSEQPVAFAPDGRSVAVAEESVRVWDATTGEPVATYADAGHVARSVAFGVGAPLLASGGDGEIRIWDVDSGRAVATLEHPGPVEFLAACGADGLLVSGGGTEVRLWDAASQELKGIATGFVGPDLYSMENRMPVIALSPRGETLASSHGDGRVYLWDLHAGELAASLDNEAPVGALSFSPDGTRLASAGASGTIRLWDATGGAPGAALQYGDSVHSIAFSPDGRWLAGAGEEGTIKIWDVGRAEPLRVLLHGAPVHGIAFSPDGQRLASAGEDGFVALWDTASGRLSGSLEPGGPLEGVVFGRDGNTLVSVRGDGTIGVWDPTTGVLRVSFQGFPAGSAGGVAFYPDDTHLLVVESSNGNADIRDTATGELTYSSLTRSLDGNLAVSPGGTILALTGVFGTVLLGNSGASPPAAAGLQVEPPGEMVLVPGGEFQFGCASTGQPSSVCSQEDALRTIYLDTYAIDKYEVTNAQYAACVRDGPCLAPNPFSAMPPPEFGDPAYANHPVSYVSWFDANTYCTWAGKRLPTEAEWVKAARGRADARIYPWGDEPPDCTRAGLIRNDSGKLVPCVPGSQPVGSHPAGASPYGAMDMCGSVGEWVNDWHQDDYHRTAPERNPPGPLTGTQKIEFGSHMTPSAERVRIDYPLLAPPGLHSWSLGFRCAVSRLPDPPPTSTPTPPPTATPVITGLVPPLVVDSESGRLYIAGQVDGTEQILALAAGDGRVLSTYPLAGPFAVDPAHGRLYIDQSESGLYVLDTRTGRQTTFVPLPAHRRAYGLHPPRRPIPRPARCSPSATTRCSS